MKMCPRTGGICQNTGCAGSTMVCLEQLTLSPAHPNGLTIQDLQNQQKDARQNYKISLLELQIEKLERRIQKLEDRFNAKQRSRSKRNSPENPRA